MDLFRTTLTGTITQYEISSSSSPLYLCLNLRQQNLWLDQGHWKSQEYRNQEVLLTKIFVHSYRYIEIYQWE